MDCNFAWVYYSLINELTQGMEHTKQLRTYLSSVAFTSTSESTPELLLQKILSAYEQSLLILKWSGSAPQSLQPLPPTGSAIEPAVSTDRSPTVDDKKRSFKDQTELIYISKRRKSWPTWTEQVKVSVENRFERPTDDGYCWRKYGQKDLPEAKHPRSYFRCAHRNLQKCWAIKTMRKLDYDPLVFEIVYKGLHTCELATNSALQAASPEKEAPNSALQAASPEKEAPNSALQAASPEKEAPNSALQAASPEKDAPNSALQAASPEKEVPNSALQATSTEKEASHHSVIVGGSSQPIVSPTTPESNYFSVSSCQMNGFETVPNLSHSESYPSDIGIFLELHHSDSDRTDTLSANTSTTSSSIGGEFTRLDFSIWSKRHPQTQDNTLQKEDKDE